MSAHLKKITAKAKQLRKSHPNMKWTSLVKMAAKKVKPAAKKRAAPKKRKVVKKRSAAPKRITVRKTTIRRTTSATIGSASTSSLMARLRSTLLEDLGKLEVKKFTSKLKRDKNKIQKLITAKKTQLRRLAK